MLEKKLKTVILLVLITSIVSCTRMIPVRLELPDEPVYNGGISKEITPVQDRGGKVMYFKASVDAIEKTAVNKAMCREYSDTLRKIILTTH